MTRGGFTSDYDGPFAPVDATRYRYASWLFVNTLEDIGLRAHDSDGADDYSLLGLAALIRKMVRDKHNLYAPVASHHPQVPVGFFVRSYRRAQQEAGRRVELRLADSTIVGDATVPMVDVKRFLATPAGEHAGKLLTVGEVIDYFAHVAGGVHFGRPSSDTEVLMVGYAESAGALLPWIRVLGHLGRIVYEGLLPLQQVVLWSGEAELSRSLRPKS